MKKLSKAINTFTNSPATWCAICVEKMNMLAKRSRLSTEFYAFMICSKRKELDWMPVEIVYMIAEYLIMPKYPKLETTGGICGREGYYWRDLLIRQNDDDPYRRPDLEQDQYDDDDDAGFVRDALQYVLGEEDSER